METETIDMDTTDTGTTDGSTAVAGTTDVGTETDSGSAMDASPAERASVLDRSLEAILMVAEEPQSVLRLASSLGRPIDEVRAAITRIAADFDGEATTPDGSSTVRRGFEVREVGGGWRIYVREQYDEVVRDFVLTETTTRLSQAALETLAVIAYKQPISRGAIAAIRAVNVDSVVRTLLGRGLIVEAFTDPETGAVHYATTDLLLTQLGVNSIEELPLISPLLSDGSEGFDVAG